MGDFDYEDDEASSATRSLLSGHTKRLDLSKFGNKLSEYKDVVFSILFYVHLLVIIILGLTLGASAMKYQNELSTTTVDKSGGLHEHHSHSQNSRFTGGIIIVASIGAFLSLSYVWLMTFFSKYLIIFTFASSICIMLGIGVVLFTLNYIAGGFSLIILAVITVAFFNLIKERIYFASVNLKVACESISSMPTIFLVPILCLLLNVCYCIVWVLAVLGVATNESDDTIAYKGKTYHLDECSSFKYSSAIQIGATLMSCAKSSCNACVCDNSVIVYKNSPCFSSELYMDPYIMLIFAVIWTSCVCGNIVVCTVAGAVSSWWKTDEHELESEDSASTDAIDLMCSTVVSNNLYRSLTSNFGSICFASLIIAFLRTIRMVLKFTIESLSYKQSTSAKSLLSRAVLFFLNMLHCLLGYVDKAMEWFNGLALCYVAIKDQSLIGASKSVISLLRDRGVSLIVNDNILDAVFFLGHATVGILCSILALVYAYSTSLTHTNTTLLVCLGFLLGIGMCSICTSVVSAAADSVFICFAETPNVFEQCHPRLYAELSESWAKIYPTAKINKDPEFGSDLLEGDELILTPPSTHPNANTQPNSNPWTVNGKLDSSSSSSKTSSIALQGYSKSSDGDRSSGLGIYSQVAQKDADYNNDNTSNSSEVVRAVHTSQAYSWNASGPFGGDQSVYFGGGGGGGGAQQLSLSGNGENFSGDIL